MRRLIIICAIGATLVASAACSDDDKKTDPYADGTTTPAATAAATKPAASSTSGATASTASTPATAPTKAGGTTKKYDAAPPLTIDTNKKYFATIKMDIGDIRLELYPKDAPQSVNSFVFLARDGYYDGVTFHRVVEGFVAQAGDPTGTGSGGPGYTIPDEVNSRKFLEGTLGMAKTSAPNSAGSQWFIDYSPQPSLDGGYTVFGQLVSGRDVLDKIKIRNPQTATTPGTVINTIVIEE
jgi:cyclophilin family peptidyl-prolyl cis-trans isomerase